MKMLKLTDEEFEVLCELVHDNNVCHSGSVIEEYQEDFDCDECPFETKRWDIWSKLMELSCEDD